MAIRPGKNISDFFIYQSLGQTVSRNFLLPSHFFIKYFSKILTAPVTSL